MRPCAVTRRRTSFLRLRRPQHSVEAEFEGHDGSGDEAPGESGAPPWTGGRAGSWARGALWHSRQGGRKVPHVVSGNVRDRTQGRRRSRLVAAHVLRGKRGRRALDEAGTRVG